MQFILILLLFLGLQASPVLPIDMNHSLNPELKAVENPEIEPDVFRAFGQDWAQLAQPSFVVLEEKSCAKMNMSSFTAVAKMYPNVMISCEAEKSTLVPKEHFDPLKDPKKVQSPEKRSRSTMFKKPKEMEFYEVAHITETNSSIIKLPILPCVRPRSTGEGSVETSIALTQILRMTAAISLPIPFYINSISGGGAFSLSGEVSYSVNCNYKDAAVRPVAEISTIFLRLHYREWNLDLTTEDYLQKGEWNESEMVKMSPNAIMLSCVSEAQVPDLCEWSAKNVERETENKLLAAKY